MSELSIKPMHKGKRMNLAKAYSLLVGVLFFPPFFAQAKTHQSISIIDNSHQNRMFSVNQSLAVPPAEQGAAVAEHYDILAFIQEAKKKLDIEIYEMRDESVKEAVFAAMQRGVVVRIVAEPDPVGNGCDAFSQFNPTNNAECQQSAPFMKKFAEFSKKHAAGSKIGFFNKNLCWDGGLDRPKYCYQHGKMLLRDDNFVALSTGNLNPSNLCTDSYRLDNVCNRDYTLVMKDPKMVKGLREIFELDLQESVPCDMPPQKPRLGGVLRKATEGHCDIEGKEVDALAHREKIATILAKYELNHVTVNPVEDNRLEKFIRSAKKSLKIQAQYLRQPEWQEAIVDALSRGVAVQTTLASFCHFNQKNGIGFIEQNSLSGPNGYLTKWLNPLFQGKNPMQLRIFNKSLPSFEKAKMAYQHAKMFVVDDDVAWIGSTNGSSTSTNVNREFGVFIKDPKMVHHISLLMDKDFNAGVSLAQHVPYPTAIANDRRFYPFGSCKVFVRNKSESSR